MVLADAVIPGMDGPNLVAECRRRWPDLPVIILTTFDDTTIIQRSLAAGAAGFLLKDISPSILTEAIAIVHDGRIYAPTWVHGEKVGQILQLHIIMLFKLQP